MNRTFFLLIHCHIFKMGPQREKEMKLLMCHGLSPWYIKSNQDAKRAVNELSAYLFFFFPPTHTIYEIFDSVPCMLSS